MASESPKEVIARFTAQILNDKRLDTIGELVAEDFEELDPLPGQRQGRDGLREVLEGLFAAFPDMHWTIHEQVSEGETVVTRFTWTGTHQGPFNGIPPTSKPVSVKGVVMDRIVAGRMQESRILMDTLGLLQQLGVVPAG